MRAYPCSPVESERLLDARFELPVQPGHQPLAELLSAARQFRPAGDGAGLDAALAAFRSASAHIAPRSVRRRSMLKHTAAKLAATKLIAAGGLALAATGGVAAAATGHLPSPLPHSGNASATARAAVSSHNPQLAPVDATSSSAPASSSSAAQPTASSTPSDRPDGTPSPSLTGLCRAWLARPHQHGKADSSAAFTVLVTTAGGTDSVAGYCTTLLSSAPSSSSSESSEPTESDDPTGEPSHSGKPSNPGAPTARPSASHPTGAPSSHPSGKPTALPTPSHPTGH